MVKLRSEGKETVMTGEKTANLPDENKTKLSDILEEERNDTANEWMATESDLKIEGAIESIRPELAKCIESIVKDLHQTSKMNNHNILQWNVQ